MSPSCAVTTRNVYPDPAAVNFLAVVPPPTSSSFGEVVVTDPLFAAVDVPAADAALSNGLTGSRPPYSRIRRSGYAVAVLNVTVTVFVPATAARMLVA